MILHRNFLILFLSYSLSLMSQEIDFTNDKIKCIPRSSIIKEQNIIQVFYDKYLKNLSKDSYMVWKDEKVICPPHSGILSNSLLTFFNNKYENWIKIEGQNFIIFEPYHEMAYSIMCKTKNNNIIRPGWINELCNLNSQPQLKDILFYILEKYKEGDKELIMVKYLLNNDCSIQLCDNPYPNQDSPVVEADEEFSNIYKIKYYPDQFNIDIYLQIYCSNTTEINKNIILKNENGREKEYGLNLPNDGSEQMILPIHISKDYIEYLDSEEILLNNKIDSRFNIRSSILMDIIHRSSKERIGINMKTVLTYLKTSDFSSGISNDKTISEEIPGIVTFLTEYYKKYVSSIEISMRSKFELKIKYLGFADKFRFKKKDHLSENEHLAFQRAEFVENKISVSIDPDIYKKVSVEACDRKYLEGSDRCVEMVVWIERK